MGNLKRAMKWDEKNQSALTYLFDLRAQCIYYRHTDVSYIYNLILSSECKVSGYNSQDCIKLVPVVFCRSVLSKIW